jgi:hypothetical protein
MIFVKIVQKIQKSIHDFTFNFSKLEFFMIFVQISLNFQFLCLDFFRCFLFRFQKNLVHNFFKIGS